MVSAAPGNLRPTITGTTVRLDWNSLAEPVTSFLIEAGSATTLANLARLNTGNPAPSLTVTNVPGGVYFVRVRAIGPDGIPGPASNEIVVIVGGGPVTCTGVPGAPTGLTAQIATNQVTLSWTASAGGCASTYVVEAGSAPGLSNIVVFNAGAATQLTANAPNGTYYVRLRGQNGAGIGPSSNEVIVITPGSSGGQDVCTYSVSPANASIVAGGAEFQVNVNTSPSSCAWSARSDSGFITVTSGASGTGSGAARFSVGANNTGPSRQGTVSILWAGGGQSVTVTQEATPTGGGGGTGGGGPTCAYTVSPTTVPLSALAGTFDIHVIAPTGCSWSSSAGSASSFANLTSPSAGSGNGTVSFSVPPNGGATRNGTVRVSWTAGAQDIAVSQIGPPPPQPTSPPVETSVTVPPQQPGVMNQTTVQEPLPSPVPNAGVCTDCRPVTGSTTVTPVSPGTVNINIDAATQDAFNALLIGVQSAGLPSSSHFRVNFVSPRTSATVAINVLASQTVAVQVAVVRNTELPVNYVTVSVPAGVNRAPRITSPGCTSTTGPGSLVTCPGAAVDDDAGDLITWAPTASHTCSWYGVSAHSPSNPLSVTLGGTVPSNFSGTCDINFAVCDQRLACTPWTGSYTWCTYTVSPLSVNVPSSGGQFTILVTASSGCAWTASSQSSFITLVSAGSGTRSGSAAFSVPTREAPSSRTGTVRISWSGGFQDVTVTQLPSPCFYATATSLNLGSAATTFTIPITVTAQPGVSCAPWSATSLSSFMTVVNPGPFSGSGQTSVNLQANNTSGSRTGTIRISFGGGSFDITVTQAGATCSYTVSPTSVNLGALGGTFDINVTTPSGCGWSASSQSFPFVSGITLIYNSGPGTLDGSGIARVSYSSNSGTTQRTGTVRIFWSGGEQVVTLTQSKSADGDLSTSAHVNRE